MRTTEVVIDSLPGLLGGQFPLRLHDGTLAVDPAGLDRIEPRALGGQVTGQNPYPPLSFGCSVVLLEPSLDPLADMPGCVIPHQKESLLALLLQLLAYPLKERDGHLTDGAAIHKAQQHPVDVGPQQSIAGQSYRLRVFLVPVFLYQTQGSPLLSPTMEGW